MVKALLTAILLFSSTVVLLAQEQFSTDNPVAYNNYIISEQSKLMDKVVEYIVQTVHNDNYREVESKRLEVIGQIERSTNKIEALKPFQGDSRMKDEALAVCNLYHDAYVNDYSKINMLKKNREQSFDAMQRYFDAQDKAEAKLRQAAERFTNAQREFAKKHEMEIVEADSDDTMHNISQVNQYSRMVFLEFFKISKLNAKCLDALNEQNVDKIEKCRDDMAKASNASYDALMKIQAFEGDDEFRAKTLAYVKYHHLFASRELKELSDILANANRTDEEIDRYNEIIKDYNNDLQTLIENFNNANLRLLRKHIPNTTFKGTSSDQNPKG